MYLVFAQAAGAAVDPGAWDAQARRFFAPLQVRAATEGWVVLVRGDTEDERTIQVRPRTDDDLRLADVAEARRGGGLGLLARRCPAVFVVGRRSGDDRAALELAAVVASVALGPILDPDVPELLGVKTARERLARR